MELSRVSVVKSYRNWEVRLSEILLLLLSGAYGT